MTIGIVLLILYLLALGFGLYLVFMYKNDDEKDK